MTIAISIINMPLQKPFDCFFQAKAKAKPDENVKLLLFFQNSIYLFFSTKTTHQYYQSIPVASSSSSSLSSQSEREREREFCEKKADISVISF